MADFSNTPGPSSDERNEQSPARSVWVLPLEQAFRSFQSACNNELSNASPQLITDLDAAIRPFFNSIDRALLPHAPITKMLSQMGISTWDAAMTFEEHGATIEALLRSEFAALVIAPSLVPQLTFSNILEEARAEAAQSEPPWRSTPGQFRSSLGGNVREAFRDQLENLESGFAAIGKFSADVRDLLCTELCRQVVLSLRDPQDLACAEDYRQVLPHFILKTGQYGLRSDSIESFGRVLHSGSEIPGTVSSFYLSFLGLDTALDKNLSRLIRDSATHQLTILQGECAEILKLASQLPASPLQDSVLVVNEGGPAEESDDTDWPLLRDQEDDTLHKDAARRALENRFVEVGEAFSNVLTLINEAAAHSSSPACFHTKTFAEKIVRTARGLLDVAHEPALRVNVGDAIPFQIEEALTELNIAPDDIDPAFHQRTIANISRSLELLDFAVANILTVLLPRQTEDLSAYAEDVQEAIKQLVPHAEEQIMRKSRMLIEIIEAGQGEELPKRKVEFIERAVNDISRAVTAFLDEGSRNGNNPLLVQRLQQLTGALLSTGENGIFCAFQLLARFSPLVVNPVVKENDAPLVQALSALIGKTNSLVVDGRMKSGDVLHEERERLIFRHRVAHFFAKRMPHYLQFCSEVLQPLPTQIVSCYQVTKLVHKVLSDKRGIPPVSSLNFGQGKRLAELDAARLGAESRLPMEQGLAGAIEGRGKAAGPRRILDSAETLVLLGVQGLARLKDIRTPDPTSQIKLRFEIETNLAAALILSNHLGNWQLVRQTVETLGGFFQFMNQPDLARAFTQLSQKLDPSNVSGSRRVIRDSRCKRSFVEFLESPCVTTWLNALDIPFVRQPTVT